jgi:protein gp37
MDIKKQCEKENVPFFFKQWGRQEFNVDPTDPTIDAEHPQHAKGGCQLRGKVYREMPATLLA